MVESPVPDHDGGHEQAVTRNLVACVRAVREHRDELDPGDVHAPMVDKG